MKKFLVVIVWLLSAFEALSMVGVGVAKFMNWTQWSGWFEGWGYGAWFTAVIGVAEILGGIGVLIPRLAAYAASGLVVVMAGAVFTTATKPNELGWQGATIHLVVLLVVLAARWRQRWRPAVPQAR